MSSSVVEWSGGRVVNWPEWSEGHLVEGLPDHQTIWPRTTRPSDQATTRPS